MTLKTYSPRELLQLGQASAGSQLHAQLRKSLGQDQALALAEVPRVPAGSPGGSMAKKVAIISGKTGAGVASRGGEGAAALLDDAQKAPQPTPEPSRDRAPEREGGHIMDNARGTPSPAPAAQLPKGMTAAGKAFYGTGTVTTSHSPCRDLAQPDWCASPFTQPAGFIRQPTAIPGFPLGMAPAMTPSYPSAMAWPVRLDAGEAVAQGEAGAVGGAIPVYWAAGPCDPTYPHIHNGQWMMPATPSSPNAARSFHRGPWGRPAMPPGVGPQQAIPSPPSYGQRGLFVDARQAVADHLSILRASLEWAEDCEVHHANGSSVEHYIRCLRQSIEHFEKMHDEQAASGKTSLTDNRLQENAGVADVEGEGMAGSLDAVHTAANPGLQRPLEDAAGLATGESADATNSLTGPGRRVSSDEDDERGIVRLFKGRNPLRQTR